VANGDVDQQIGLARHSYIHSYVADFQIGTTVALTREHPLAAGSVAGGLTDELQRLQNVLMRDGPVGTMAVARVDMVPSTVTTHEIPLIRVLHIRERSHTAGLLVKPKN
jgi:hypothetical protein